MHCILILFQTRQSFSPVRSASSSSRDKHPQHADEEEKKTSTNNKQPRNKWLPLEINIGKNKSNKNRTNRASADGQSTVSEGDKDWRADMNDLPRNGRHSRSISALRGRGIRNRGGSRAPSYRNMNRDHGESENDMPDFHVSFFLAYYNK